MSWWEILIIVAAAGFVVAVTATAICNKARGKHSCDCGGNCAGCAGCSARPKEPRDKK